MNGGRLDVLFIGPITMSRWLTELCPSEARDLLLGYRDAVHVDEDSLQAAIQQELASIQIGEVEIAADAWERLLEEAGVRVSLIQAMSPGRVTADELALLGGLEPLRAEPDYLRHDPTKNVRRPRRERGNRHGR